MEKSINGGGEAPMTHQKPQSEGKKQTGKMQAQRSTRSSGAGALNTVQEAAREDPEEEFITPEPGWSCKKLAIEVAKILAPDIKAALETTVSNTLTQLQQEVGAHSVQLSELENRVQFLEDDLKETQNKLVDLLNSNGALRDKVDDLENRSRRSNLRMVGLPESILHTQLIPICTSELPQALGLSGSFVVERAHRVGPLSNTSGPSKGGTARPRQVIMKFLNYADKALIMQAYKKSRGEVSIRGHKILLFNDFSAEVARKRRAFASVCTELFKQQRRFFLQFPATLRVFREDGSTEVFHSPDEAMEALQSKSGDGSCPGTARKRNRSERRRSPPLSGE